MPAQDPALLSGFSYPHILLFPIGESLVLSHPDCLFGDALKQDKEGEVKATVDQDTCTGCALCPDTCPEVFEMNGDTATAKVDVVPPEAEDTCRVAKEGCPVEAISIEE
jgi:ferredoxin